MAATRLFSLVIYNLGSYPQIFTANYPRIFGYPVFGGWAVASDCRGGCTSDRFQPGFWVIAEHCFSKPADRRDLTLGELASGPVKSVIHVTQVGSEVYRDPAPAAPHPAARAGLVAPPTPHHGCPPSRALEIDSFAYISEGKVNIMTMIPAWCLMSI